MDERWVGRLRRVAALVAVVAAGVVALEVLVGVDAVVAEVLAADRSLFPFVVGGVACGLAARGIGLWLILRAFDTRRSLPRCIALVPMVTFVNRLVPSGQAGGSAVNGLVAGRVLRVPYEVGLATVVSAIAINNAIILSLALAGAGYLTALGAGGDYGAAAATVAGLLGLVTVATALVWRHPDRAHEGARRVLTRVLEPVARTLPRVDPADLAVDRRLRNVRDAVGRLARSPRHVVAVVVLQTGGRLLRMVALWVAFLATGSSVDPAVLLVVVPVAMAAAVVPLPGGGGGVEATLVALLVAITGLDAAALTAGVLLFRGLSVATVATGAGAGSAYTLR